MRVELGLGAAALEDQVAGVGVSGRDASTGWEMSGGERRVKPRSLSLLFLAPSRRQEGALSGGAVTRLAQSELACSGLASCASSGGA